MTSTELVPATERELPTVALGTLVAHTPDELVRTASAMATPLARLIEQRQLYVTLRGRKHVRVEGWTTLAAMLGVTPHEVETLETEGIYISTIEMRRMSDGQAISRASGECGRADETDADGHPTWATRPGYARRSMAQTRATSKACRLAFSWIMTLAGYDATPAEEMEGLGHGASPRAMPQPHKAETIQPAAPTATPISEPQQRRLFAKSKAGNHSTADVKAWLETRYGYAHTTEVLRTDYDAICTRLENPAPLGSLPEDLPQDEAAAAD